MPIGAPMTRVYYAYFTYVVARAPHYLEVDSLVLPGASIPDTAITGDRGTPVVVCPW